MVTCTTCLELPLQVKLTRLILVRVRKEEGDSDHVCGVPECACSCMLGHVMLAGRGVIVCFNGRYRSKVIGFVSICSAHRCSLVGFGDIYSASGHNPSIYFLLRMTSLFEIKLCEAGPSLPNELFLD